MKKILNILFEHRNLTRNEAKDVLLEIGKGVFNEHELSAFMTVFLMRSISMPELLGFRDALLEICIPIDLEERKTIDIVGTGGDGKNTFNISTLACFIVAGAGQPVAKHGSYGASSISGASRRGPSVLGGCVRIVPVQLRLLPASTMASPSVANAADNNS